MQRQFNACAPAGGAQDSETHLGATDPLPHIGREPIIPCGAYSCTLIMMILNDEVGLNNDSQLKARNVGPCSRANKSYAPRENT